MNSLVRVPIVALSGKTGVGKTTVALEVVRHFGAIHMKTSSVILTRRPDTEQTRLGLQEAGNALDRETDHAWIADELRRLAETHPEVPIVVDAVRVPMQIDKLKRAVPSLTHIHLTASRAKLLSRFEGRKRGIDDGVDYGSIEADVSEQWDSELAASSDFCICTDSFQPAEISKMIIDFTKP